MQVFVTGASGWVGQKVVAELLDHGHTVLGLARNDAAADKIARAGARVHRGELTDPASLRRGAAQADGVIHCAFIHDFTRFAENCEIERRALEAIGDELSGSSRPLLVTSGTGLLSSPTGVVDERSRALGPNPRIATEQLVDTLAERGLHTSAIRLPPTTHGAGGDHGFTPRLIALARATGVAAYIGGGDNVWAAVHRVDAAKVYRLALEKSAVGARYHAVAESGIAMRELAAAIGRGLGVPVMSKAPGAEAAAHFGGFTAFASMGCRTSSQWTREQLGWQPDRPTLIDDLEHADYFAT
ncbi:SDR family oxidoreductase [Solimonas marina]|uniref:SDR family oxidoreductase n=1 Tax=Solimonas marina TaxID=2714601 RepID=A0A970B497_9GAMM|nr:SDR family oxidoreductase [Solimonas marina]NKF22102.1 SDR family oxidoreductase [Solimonas marina]